MHCSCGVHHSAPAGRLLPTLAYAELSNDESKCLEITWSSVRLRKQYTESIDGNVKREAAKSTIACQMQNCSCEVQDLKSKISAIDQRTLPKAEFIVLQV